MTPMGLAWRSVVRRPLSSLSTVLVLGGLWAALLPLLALLADGLDRTRPIDVPTDVIVGPKSSGLSLLLASTFQDTPPEDVIPWGLVPSLRDEIGPLHQMTLHVVGTWRGHTVVGTDESWLRRPAPLESPQMTQGRWFRTPEEAVIGRDVAERLGIAVGDTLAVRSSPSADFVEAALARGAPEPSRWSPAPTPFSSDVDRAMYAELVEVVGVVDHGGGPWDALVFLHREATLAHFTHQQIASIARELSEEGPTTFLFVATRDAAQRDAVLRLLTRHSVAHAIDVATEASELTRLSQQRRRLARGTHAAAALLALTLLLAVAAGRFRQRKPTRELLLSLGYPRGVTARVVTWELVLLVSAAALLALGLSAQLMPWMTARVGLEPLSTAALLREGLFLSLAPLTTIGLLFFGAFLRDQGRAPHLQHL